MKEVRQFFSALTKMHLNNMTEIEKEEVKFPVLFNLVAGDCNIMEQYITFNSIIYIIQLCKGNNTALHICLTSSP